MSSYLPNDFCVFITQSVVYKHKAPMIIIRDTPTSRPARSIPQGMANKEVPIMVFHIANLRNFKKSIKISHRLFSY